MKILASVSSNQCWPIYKAVLDELPEADFRFIGFERTSGLPFLQNGYNYVSMPIFYSSSIGNTKGELEKIGFSKPEHSLFPRDYGLRSLAAYCKFAEMEVQKFKPDAVLVANYDCAACHILMKIARHEGLRLVSLHTSFLKDRYIVDCSSGRDWEDQLRSIPLADSVPANFCAPKLRNGTTFAVFGQQLSYLKKRRYAERLLRMLPGTYGTDSIRVIAASRFTKAIPRQWFPEIPSLRTLQSVQDGFFLVGLHMPLLEGKTVTWKDLLRFAVQCLPEHMPLVIRPHPAEDAPLWGLADLSRAFRGKKVFISRKGEGPGLDALLAHCRTMVTINSATGVEALLHGKPVLTLVPTFYSRPGCATHVRLEDAHSIRAKLAADQMEKPDMNMVRTMVSRIIEHYSVADPAKDCTGAKQLARILAQAAEPPTC